jgi:hypothetical protein
MMVLQLDLKMLLIIEVVLVPCSKPRKKGGLGIENLSIFNINLLCKSWQRSEASEGP